MAVKDRTDIGVFRAAKEYIYGTVPDHDRRFAPSVAEFSTRVRMHDSNGESAVRLAQKYPEKRQEFLDTLIDEDDRRDMRMRFEAADKLLGYSVGFERDD